MKSYNIVLKNDKDIASLLSVIEPLNCEVDLACGRYVVDAKSILGVLSIGFGKTCKLSIHDDNAIIFEDKIKSIIIGEVQE